MGKKATLIHCQAEYLQTVYYHTKILGARWTQPQAQDIPQNTVVFRPILNGISEWGVNSPFNGRLDVENLA